MFYMIDNYAATLGFDRSNFAVYLGESKQSPLSLGTVPKSAKTFLPRIPLVSTVKQYSVFKGFFAPMVAANAATDKAPTWASCIEYIGLSLPLIASRANLVKVSRNLCRLSGITSAMRIELTRPSALGLGNCIRMEKEAMLISLPLR